MLCATETMAISVENSDMGVSPTNATCAIRSTYHMVLKAFLETANLN